MNRVAIIVSQDGMETAYKALNVAMAAAAMDAKVHVFCTFGGLSLLRRTLNYAVPDSLEPFRDRLAALPSPEALRAMALEANVHFVACQMTMDLMGMTPDDLMEGIPAAGATTFLSEAQGASTVTF